MKNYIYICAYNNENNTSKEFWNMREMFEKKYLTQESIDSFLQPCACLPIIYLSNMTENEDGDLVFEEGDKNILPPRR